MENGKKMNACMAKIHFKLERKVDIKYEFMTKLLNCFTQR